MKMKWVPQPRQVEFMSRPEDEVFYGGAAGGGKSDALVCEALRQVDKRGYKAVIFRKTYPQLEDLILKSKLYYSLSFPKAKYNEQQHTWTFPSGAKIMFRSMPNRTSFQDYQGRSYSFIGFDELTQFTQEEYEYLFSRCRSDAEGIRCYIRATGNPGGIGHGWVKERFVSAMPPNTTREFEYVVKNPKGDDITVKKTRRFVPSSVFDNPALLANNPSYLANLASMPEALKKALLYGEWDSFSGQAFPEWKNNPDGYQTHLYTHVIEPFEIPKSWTRYRAYDFGYTHPFSVLWCAVSPDGVIYLYRELYGCTDSPNVGVRWEAKEQAEKVKEIEDSLERGNTVFGVADPAIWDESRGRSGCVVEAFNKQGIYFTKGKNARLSGKMQVHQRLRFDENGRCGFYVFNTCRSFIRTFPALQYSTVNIEDIDTNGEDHSYDAIRYLFMEKPMPSREKAKPIYVPKNPLA